MDGHWPSIVNFRDIGGVLGVGGRQVLTGRVFRGVALHDASDADLAALADLRVGLVFDLRSTQEVAALPDKLPAGARYVHMPAVREFEDATTGLLDWDALIDEVAASPEALAESEAFHARVYAGMIERPQVFAALVHEMLDAGDSAIYVHCAAGKDRTGVACAIIQRLLGVSHDDALKGYLVSNDNPLPDVDEVRARARQRGVETLIDLMTGAQTWQFDMAWDQMDQAWGGWDNFVRDGLQLTPRDVETLQATYLSVS